MTLAEPDIAEGPPATPFAYGFAKARGVLLLDAESGVMGLREGADPLALVEARRAFGRPIAVQPMTRADFERRLSEVYADQGLGAAGADDALPGGLEGLVDEIPAAADLLDSQDDAPIIRLINGMIAEAARLGASDIHIEPFETALTVRFRIDGVLRQVLSLSARLAPLLVSRVKVMARLDIAERRIPQDGRIALALGGRALDVRISTLPSRAGERVVMRILDQEQGGLGLEQLGMQPNALAAFRDALAEPNGVILVTGPTGSGKTTSLYAGLQLLNDASRNILTIEDPVEYAMAGVGQTQVNAKVGMTFAAGLRAILRQDPDVVMVGEIRDVETAQIAVQASLTGHLVLSTVHTNDAAGAVTRLRDMGVEPFLLASSLRLIVAQRLVRRLCEVCKRPEPADAGAARLAGVTPGTIVHRAVGCPECSHTGYNGRLGLYEVLRITDTVRRLIGADGDEREIAAAGLLTQGDLATEARACVARGATTIEEAIRVTRQETRDAVRNVAEPDAAV